MDGRRIVGVDVDGVVVCSHCREHPLTQVGQRAPNTTGYCSSHLKHEARGVRCNTVEARYKRIFKLQDLRRHRTNTGLCEHCGTTVVRQDDNSIRICQSNPECRNVYRLFQDQLAKEQRDQQFLAPVCRICGTTKLQRNNSVRICQKNRKCGNAYYRTRYRLVKGSVRVCKVCNKTKLHRDNTTGICQSNRECRNEHWWVQSELARAEQGPVLVCQNCGKAELQKDNTTGICKTNRDCRNAFARARRQISRVLLLCVKTVVQLFKETTLQEFALKTLSVRD